MAYQLILCKCRLWITTAIRLSKRPANTHVKRYLLIQAIFRQAGFHRLFICLDDARDLHDSRGQRRWQIDFIEYFGWRFVSRCRGSIVCNGSLKHQPATARQHLSFCPADCPVFPFLTAHEWLAFLGSVRGHLHRKILDHLLDAFQLSAQMNTRFDQLSLGTARKILLLGNIAAETEVLILDEPSNGLDTINPCLAC